MTIIDILIISILLYGAWSGFSKGVLVQLSGIFGIIVGAWIATNFSDKIVKWLDVETSSDTLVFIVVTIVMMLIVVILVRLLSKVIDKIGLSLPFKLLGLAVGVLKYVVVMALLFGCYLRISKRVYEGGDNKNIIEKSFFYQPLRDVSNLIFPFIIKQLDDIEEVDKSNSDFKEI